MTKLFVRRNLYGFFFFSQLTFIHVVAPKKLPKYGTNEYKNIDWELEEKRDLLQNVHWTPEMRAVVPKVKALLA